MLLITCAQSKKLPGKAERFGVSSPASEQFFGQQKAGGRNHDRRLFRKKKQGISATPGRRGPLTS